VIAAALDHVRSSGCREVRLYGEMVDLLWGTRLGATVELERLWDEVLRDERLSLLCAYRLDPLDHQVQGALRQVTQCHSHLLPAENHERFERAIDRAYAEVFGVGADVDTLRELMVSAQNLPTAMREAQAAMFALDTMPDVIAQDVRARAHRHFVNGSFREL
jgi:MEDS: MEthanogen/methylotroph, DcmR Sensory domain